MLLVGKTEKMIDLMKLIVSGIYKIFLSLGFAMIIISYHEIPVYLFHYHILRNGEIILALTDIFHDRGPNTCFFHYFT